MSELRKKIGFLSGCYESDNRQFSVGNLFADSIQELQFIENDDSNSLIVAATNNLTSLDTALFRRFSDVLHYEKPTVDEIMALVQNRIGTFSERYSIEAIADYAFGLSHAEITQACDDAIKEAILADKEKVTRNSLMSMLADKRTSYGPNS